MNYYGLKFIFSDLKPNEELYERYSDEAFLEGEQQLMDKYGEKAKKPVKSYYDLAFKLIEDSKLLGAITVFKRASEAYPKYVGILTKLAQLYEQTGQVNKAIDTYSLGIERSKQMKLGYEDGFQQAIAKLKEDWKDIKYLETKTSLLTIKIRLG